MKILVTGGAGFIGSNIADRYIELGHTVHIIDNMYAGKIENVNPKATFEKLDIKSDEANQYILDEKFDIISHHAAQMDVRVSVNDPKFDASENIIGSLNVYEAAKNSGVKKIIFASSGGTVYGEQLEHPCKEDHPLNPCSPYGISKMVNEKYLFYYKEVFGIDYAVMRYGNVYGRRQNPHGEAGVIAIFCNKMFNNENAIINGDGLITRDYIYIDDVISANELALRDDFSGIFNITNGVETNVNTIFNSIKNLTGSNQEEIHGPAKAGEQRRSVCDITKMKNMFGWQPNFAFEEGIKLTVDYYRKKLNA
jgi:UDP-glucose 4-epimerase